MEERIEKYFQSDDRELWKLGRILCHELRIDYYVEVKTKLTNMAPFSRGLKGVKKVLKYSVYKIENSLFTTVYEIKLRKWKNN